jgi:branched-chain amino acid transport system substrate-binding protein/urea transport system substrate-binding protein
MEGTMILPRRDFVRTVGLGSVAAGTLGFPHIARAATVKVGAALPFSGGLELFGDQARIGLDLAAAEINAAGGILGSQVEIIYEDNKTDPKTTNERARKLIQSDEVIAVTGPITSAARDAMAGTMERYKTPLLYATNYEGGGCNRYLFFFNTVPNQDAAPLIRYMDGRFGTSYYMFGADYVWPRKMFEASRTVIDELGGTILGEDYVPLFTVKDYASIIKKIADSGAEILVFALPGVDGVTFIKQAEEFGLLQKVTVGFLGFTETYLGAFGEGKGEGMYACVPFVASDPAPGVQDFVGRIRSMHGPDTVVSFYVMTHYDALMALKAGLEKSGEISREAAVDGMAGLTYDVPTGPSTITAEDHHSALEMYISRTAGGQIEVVEHLGLIEPNAQC